MESRLPPPPLMDLGMALRNVGKSAKSANSTLVVCLVEIYDNHTTVSQKAAGLWLAARA